MRVLIVHSRYRSGAASGENRVVEDEARLLADYGHDVAVWTPSVREGGGVSMVRAAANAIWSTSATSHLRDLIERHRPDVVHAHNVFRALSPAVLRAVPSSVALVMTLHNYRLSCLPGNLYPRRSDMRGVCRSSADPRRRAPVLSWLGRSERRAGDLSGGPQIGQDLRSRRPLPCRKRVRPRTASADRYPACRGSR